MAKYSINDTTLTAIGDAIRNKVGHTRIELVKDGYEPTVVVAKTDNVTDSGEFVGLPQTEDLTYYHIEFPYATKVKVRISYKMISPQTLKVRPSRESGTTLKGYNRNDTESEDIFAYNTLSFEFASLGIEDTGFYAECIPLDADNNELAEVRNVFTPAKMAEEINSFDTIPEEAYTITGNCQYAFANCHFDWFIDQYGDKITTDNITYAQYMFSGSRVKSIPFEFNFNNSSNINVSNMFTNCADIKEIGNINNLKPDSLSSMFSSCTHLRQLPTFNNFNPERIQTYQYANCGGMFSSCMSLRSIPEDFLKQIKGIQTSPSYVHLSNMFQNCQALDEIRGLSPMTGAVTSNMFSNTFSRAGRLKAVIFATQEDGTPYTVNWKSQTMNFGEGVGYNDYESNVINFNSGITADKRVTDDASYQALKDDPDWFTTDLNYSRYNRTSAVATINSLPDVSAGSGNAIRFVGVAGSKTDGGAINTLTEEEIAVATAKGWTVTFV